MGYSQVEGDQCATWSVLSLSFLFLLLLIHPFADPHGHGLGSHAAHGPEGNAQDRRIEISEKQSDVESGDHQPPSIDDSAAAQIIGVMILEFGVVLHR